MKSLLLNLCFLYLPFLGFSQIAKPLSVAKESEIELKTYTGIISEDYSNGQPKIWKNMVNGQASGLWLEWYPNGNIRYRAYWKDNRGNGKWEYFYPDGTLSSEGVYQDDIPLGLHRTFHSNGQLESECTYLNGKKNGVEYTYGSDGSWLSSQTYVDGEKVLDAPILFEEGLIATANNNEWGLTFTPDGNTMYFTRRKAGEKAQKIYFSNKEKGQWSIPTIASFSTATDGAVFISPDGKKLFFESQRPLPGIPKQKDYDTNIWVVNKVDNGWSEPISVGSNINKVMSIQDEWPANYEAGPTTDREGNLYYWTKSTQNKSTNLYTAKVKADGTFEDPQEMGFPPNSKGYDSSMAFSPDGNYLFFTTSGRNDSYGGEDIYYSKKINGAWSEPKNLGPTINSGQYEGCPQFSPDGKYFFFSSSKGSKVDNDGEGISSIYYMETRYLMID